MALGPLYDDREPDLFGGGDGYGANRIPPVLDVG